MPPSHRRRRLLIGGLVVVVLLLVGGGAFAWWYLRDDAPDEVSIEGAAAQVESSSSTTTVAPGDTGPAETEPPAARPAGIDGEWQVDTTIGEFSYEDSTGTFVGFRVQEELAGVGSKTAVGRTPTVSGTLVIDGTTVTEVTVEADMSDITTNDSRRDDRVQGALDTSQFPTATFVLTTPIELPEGALTGEAVTVDAAGDLTVHGVTRPVVLPLEAQLVDDTIVVVGSLDMTFADYGVEVPSSPIVVSAEDHGPLELQLFFTRAA